MVVPFSTCKKNTPIKNIFNRDTTRQPSLPPRFDCLLEWGYDQPDI